MPHNDIMYDHFMKGKYINHLSDNSGLYGVCQSGCVNSNQDRSGSRLFSFFECGCVCVCGGGGGGAHICMGRFPSLFEVWGSPKREERGSDPQDPSQLGSSQISLRPLLLQFIIVKTGISQTPIFLLTNI